MKASKTETSFQQPKIGFQQPKTGLLKKLVLASLFGVVVDILIVISSLPEGRSIGYYTTWGRDKQGGFPLPSSQTIMCEQLVQGCYAVAGGRFEPATFRLQGTEHIATAPRR